MVLAYLVAPRLSNRLQSNEKGPKQPTLSSRKRRQRSLHRYARAIADQRTPHPPGIGQRLHEEKIEEVTAAKRWCLVTTCD